MSTGWLLSVGVADQAHMIKQVRRRTGFTRAIAPDAETTKPSGATGSDSILRQGGQ
jgi:hypothetical protein